MGKKKGGKSKGSKKKKTSEKEQKDTLPEVDKEFFEIQISDLTHKLTRLRGKNTELSSENVDLRCRYQQLDEDRADIIAHLTRLLDEKTRECEELQERLEALEKLRDQDHEDFSNKISSMQQEYTLMHDRLQAELKVIKGKLNSLEEFRHAKEDLMRKFEEQENNFQLQEKRHEEQLYEVEKQFILDRDRLQKELEKRLLQLSEDFQKTFQLRIASHTQRVIRENVAVNNELHTLMTSWKTLMDENLQLRNDNTKLKIDVNIMNSNKNEAIKNNLQKDQLILDLKDKYIKMKVKYSQITEYERKNNELENQILKCKEENNESQDKIKELNNQLGAMSKLSKDGDSKLHITRYQLERLQNIVHQAAATIKDTVEVQSAEQEIAKKKAERHKLILTLFEILNSTHSATKSELDNFERVSNVAMASREEVKKLSYEQGNLGIIPKTDIIK